jgi:type IV pilus assembly protein PilB
MTRVRSHYSEIADPIVPDTLPARPRRAPTRRRLGQLLLERGVITEDQLARALSEKSTTGERLGTALVRLGLLTESELVDALSTLFAIPTVTVPEDGADPAVVQLVPALTARKYDLFPVRRINGCLTVAMADPRNLRALDDVAFATSLRVVPGIAPLSAIRRALDRYYGASAAQLALSAEVGGTEVELIDAPTPNRSADLADLRAWADQAPVIRLVNMLLGEAIAQAASDIHLEPFETGLHVRYRLDGVLQRMRTLPKRVEAGLVSRIKIMADLDIAERRLPQDGRLKLRYEGREIDVRVSSMPTVCGESVCLRLLDRQAVRLNLSELGLDEANLEQFTRAIDSQDGMILITGPTGSGKTTTLYSAIERLRPRDVKIMTVEDPVEYYLDGVTQVAVHDDIGRTFATVLRTFLRHDPDILLVGEMRDGETAQIGIRAALTGHLVLATLHTIDSPSAIPRLLDMGIPGSLLASCLRLTVAQRLVRRLCTACREPYEADARSLTAYGHRSTGSGTVVLYRGRGCPSCRFTGMRGRVAVYELMPTSPEIAALIARNGSTNEIRDSARRNGSLSLRQAGLLKVVEGVTTMAEVLRVTPDEGGAYAEANEPHQ